MAKLLFRRVSPKPSQHKRLYREPSATGLAKTLIKTKNFTRFTNGKKFSCYCGSAPFEHSSGTSIKKRTRISHLADKSMKTLLTQAAKTAIQHDKELKQYYQRRTDMGKSKRSTMNVVRNKLIHRMFAVIKRQTPYINQYLKSA
ncbi:MAG: transposase [Chitinophagales bacterium]